MKSHLIQDMLSRIDDRYILESHPDVVLAERQRDGLYDDRPPAWKRFMNSGWGVAAVSVLVGLGVVIGIAAAGRLGTVDPGGSPGGNPGVTPGTQQNPPAAQNPYTLTFTSHGDGTCTVHVAINDNSTALYDLEIPAKSPAGDTVTELDLPLTDHDLLPAVLSDASYERYIVEPLEALYGITVENAQAIEKDYDHPDSEKSFYLRKFLAQYSTHLDGTTNHYLEPTLDDDERLYLHRELTKTGFTAADLEDIRRETAKDSSEAEVSTSASIRTITLPYTLTSIPDLAFGKWIDLDSIIYTGTEEAWSRLTATHVEIGQVPVNCLNVPGKGETPTEASFTFDYTLSATTLRPGDSFTLGTSMTNVSGRDVTYTGSYSWQTASFYFYRVDPDGTRVRLDLGRDETSDYTENTIPNGKTRTESLPGMMVPPNATTGTYHLVLYCGWDEELCYVFENALVIEGGMTLPTDAPAYTISTDYATFPYPSDTLTVTYRATRPGVAFSMGWMQLVRESDGRVFTLEHPEDDALLPPEDPSEYLTYRRTFWIREPASLTEGKYRLTAYVGKTPVATTEIYVVMPVDE